MQCNLSSWNYPSLKVRLKIVLGSCHEQEITRLLLKKPNNNNKHIRVLLRITNGQELHSEYPHKKKKPMG